MNTKDAFILLMDYIKEFEIHPLFIKELQSLLKKELKGKETRFFNLLITQLKNIKDFGVMVYTVDSNEKLKGTTPVFYSIHLQQTQFNVRLLIHITEEQKCYLLAAFYERSGKKNSDYTPYIPVLQNRLKEMEET